ncbi:F-box protein [Corchorus olitorius]|uniref:F-box protein n=1 Tax=Corchorus olitorius TaxID=93759 RepID=A0A1R3KWL6_9ROSI|nr:F-box protein [Corchorus olitorius]
MGFTTTHLPKEYRLLYLRMKTLEDGFVEDYGIIKAGENKGRRLYLQSKSNNIHDHDRIRIPCPCPKSPWAATPVVVKNFLYWMAEKFDFYKYQPRPCQHSIIGFNTDAEDLFTLPHPDDNICQPSAPHCPRINTQMRLLEMEDRLTCWCLGVASADVWVLNYDDENYYTISNNINNTIRRLWSLWCHLNFDRDFRSYPFFYSPNTDIRLVSFRNNEVLLIWNNRGVFRYNLSTWKVRKVDLKGSPSLRYLNLDRDVFLVAHTKSVVFLEDPRDGRQSICCFESKQPLVDDEVK